MNFKEKHSFDDRKEVAHRIRTKYPHRYPVIIEPADDCTIDIQKRKFLINQDATVAHVIHQLKKQMKVDSWKAIFLFVNNVLPSAGAKMSNIYETYKDEDGMLYMKYAEENTFGFKETSNDKKCF